jgi:hypothetical protein
MTRSILLLALAVIALVIFAIVDLHRAVQGWLCAFVFVSMVPIGSLALLLIHGFTGGRWGDDLKPVLIPAARCIPLLLIAVLPVLLLRTDVYNWQDIDLPEDVLRSYMAPAAFDARTLIALLLWSGLAWSGAWRNTVSAAVGSVIHLVLLSLIPPDWIMTLAPGGISAGFGFGFGCEQIFVAAAFAALLARQGDDPRATRDLTGIMVTALLATMYFLFMQFLIVWYGNVPAKIHWYAARDADGWSTLALLAFLIGAAAPFLAILNPLVRSRPQAARIAGALVLIGVALHVAWMTLPAFGSPAIIPMILAMVALIAALAWLSPMVPIRQARAHG